MNEEAKLLARVAIEAREEFWRINAGGTVCKNNSEIWKEREDES